MSFLYLEVLQIRCYRTQQSVRKGLTATVTEHSFPTDATSCAVTSLSSLTVPVQPVFALTVEQQLVVDIRQQELDAPALNAQLVLHQHDGTAVVASLWTRDDSDLITEEADVNMRSSNTLTGQNICVYLCCVGLERLHRLCWRTSFITTHSHLSRRSEGTAPACSAV